MTETRHLPDPNRVSVLTAAVLLAFALTRVIEMPRYEIALPLGSLDLSFVFNMDMFIVLIAAGLTAVGMDWMLRTHPSLQAGETREHWLLPTLTVFVIGIVLYSLPQTAVWWLGFGLGAALLLVVFVAEYVAVDSTDARYPLATIMLTALAFVIFLALAVALKASAARLVLVAPALFFASGLTALRTLHLRLNERWEFAWAVGIAVIATQLGAAMHYLPLTPVHFGLVLLGPVYGLTVMAVQLIETTPLRRAIVEPAIMLAIFWGLAFVFR